MNEIASQAAANQVVTFKVCGATSSQSCFPCGSDPQIPNSSRDPNFQNFANFNFREILSTFCRKFRQKFIKLLNNYIPQFIILGDES